MADTDGSDTHVLTAEYKDGKLQIVEVTPFEKVSKEPGGEEHILPDGIPDNEHKYMQILDSDKGLVQLDLMNLTLVRCEDGEESYRLVAGGEAENDGTDTVTCVLQSSDGDDDNDNQEYVMMEGDQGSLVFLQQSSLPQTNAPGKKEKKEKKSALSPAEILEKAKALQKAKALMSQTAKPSMGKRGRKRKGDLPPPHELLASPNFKLYLYSCKLCSFKCNAVKELTAHKSSEHGSNSSRHRSGAPSRGYAITLQCARCPFRGGTHPQLMKHVQEKHADDKDNFKVTLHTKEVEDADVLVCGACGFESSSRNAFRRHIENEHGANSS